MNGFWQDLAAYIFVRYEERYRRMYFGISTSIPADINCERVNVVRALYREKERCEALEIKAWLETPAGNAEIETGRMEQLIHEGVMQR